VTRPKTLHPNNTESIWIVSDLKDDEAWRQAHAERRAWGKEFADLHILDHDHVLMVLRPGGAQKLVR
jgi:hypothetical protein